MKYFGRLLSPVLRENLTNADIYFRADTQVAVCDLSFLSIMEKEGGKCKSHFDPGEHLAR